MLTMALHFNDPGLMNDVVRQIARLMSRLAGKSKDRESNERQRLAEVSSTNERRDMAIKLAARTLGCGAGGENGLPCKRKWGG